MKQIKQLLLLTAYYVEWTWPVPSTIQIVQADKSKDSSDKTPKKSTQLECTIFEVIVIERFFVF